MKVASLAGLLLLAGAVVTGQQLTLRDPGAAIHQIRLDRPVGGGQGGGGGGGSPSPAPSGLVMDLSVDEVLAMMQGLKYSAVSIEKGKTSSYIKAMIDDQPTYVFLNNCTDSRCRALYFVVYLGNQSSVTDAFIHDYNRNTMFTKMAKDKDGDLMITMGVSLARGVSQDHVRLMCESWISYFHEALAYKPEGQ